MIGILAALLLTVQPPTDTEVLAGAAISPQDPQQLWHWPRRGRDRALRQLTLAALFGLQEEPGCVLLPHPRADWSEPRHEAPFRSVRRYAGPPSRETRDIFVGRALTEGERQVDCLAELERRDRHAFERFLFTSRDEAWLAGRQRSFTAEEIIAATEAALAQREARGLAPPVPHPTVPYAGIAPFSPAGQTPQVILYVTPAELAEPSATRTLRAVPPPADVPRVRRYTTDGDLVSEVTTEDRRGRVRITATPH